MSPLDLDARYTFDSFIVGPANRLAVAASRRVAESPGSTYNPLFIYSGSGLGKTHLLTAIGHHARSVEPELAVVYDSLEHLMEEVRSAVEAGEKEAFRGQLAGAGILALDDVQFLAGHRQTQEELLRAWDAHTASGGQVVLTSDRPPQEIDGLDERLLSRLSGGLIVDIGAPDYEMRIAIVRKKAGERGQTLEEGVPEALARIAFGNVRELQGGLNRLLAVQELEQRQVTADEVPELLGSAGTQRGRDEFGEFMSDIAGTVTEVMAGGERLLADAIMRWEGEGFQTRRLNAALGGPMAPGQTEELIRRFESDVARLAAIEDQLHGLEPDAPELQRQDILRDPDRVNEAETLLVTVQARHRALQGPPTGATFEQVQLPRDSLAVRAALAVADAPGRRYNPLFLHGPPGSGKTTLGAALCSRIRTMSPETRIGFVPTTQFSDELIEALEQNQLEAWRARYRSAHVLFLDDIQALSDTERAQEELFHLFEDLQRRGAQLIFTSEKVPQEMEIQERLRTRLESGLVVELPASEAKAKAGAESAGPGSGSGEATLMTREKVVWEWPYAEDWLVETLD